MSDHRHTDGTDMPTNRPDATLRPSKASKADTGEAIDEIVLKPAQWQYDDYVKAKAQLQELIRGEVVRNLDLLYWKYKELNGQSVAVTFVEAYDIIATEVLSSGQTDGHA